MRDHGHLWLFAFLLLFTWEGPAAEAADRGRSPADAGEAGTPILLATPPALPASPTFQWSPEDDTGYDPDGSETGPAAAPSIAPPSLGRLHARERAWLSFRRPFSHTVSYRTTAPPSRVA